MLRAVVYLAEGTVCKAVTADQEVMRLLKQVGCVPSRCKCFR